MKFAFCSLLLFVGACRIQEDPNDRVIKSEVTHYLDNALDKNREQPENQNPGLLQTSFAKINALFHVFDEPSPFCRAILQDSPTREDYIRNWQQDGELTYCAGALQLIESCQKKHNDAFEEGLLCYKNQLFSSDQ